MTTLVSSTRAGTFIVTAAVIKEEFMEIFAYEFMQKAFIVALCISVITPLIGGVIVLKGLSNMGEALSHSALAGIALGLITGINPLVGAICFALIAALLIEGVSRIFKGFSEIATSIVLALGIGLASIFSGFVKNAAALNSYMFGSIVATTDLEVMLTIGLSILVVLLYVFNYKNLFQIAFDQENARLCGVKVNGINFLFMLLTAITVALSCKTVGALIVSSLMVIPVACSMRVSRSYFSGVLIAIGFAAVFMVGGLIISYYWDIKPGGTIVLIGVVTLLILSVARRER